MRASRFALGFFASILATAIGCRREAEIETAPAAFPSVAPASTAADQLRPGELAEGKERVYGLVLPRDFRVVRRFGDSTVARGAPPAEQVANYVRERIEAETVEIGPMRTVFVNARLNDEDPERLLRIEVAQQPSASEIVVKDVTPVPIDPELTEEERWRKAGLSPSGKQLGLQEMQ